MNLVLSYLYSLTNYYKKNIVQTYHINIDENKKYLNVIGDNYGYRCGLVGTTQSIMDNYHPQYFSLYKILLNSNNPSLLSDSTIINSIKIINHHQYSQDLFAGLYSAPMYENGMIDNSDQDKIIQLRYDINQDEYGILRFALLISANNFFTWF
jgi:hypothetical protein